MPLQTKKKRHKAKQKERSGDDDHTFNNVHVY